MSDVKLKITGIREVLRSAPVQAELVRRARRIREAAGEGHEVVAKPHQYTSRAFVQTAAAEAARSEAENKTLTRALDAGR